MVLGLVVPATPQSLPAPWAPNSLQLPIRRGLSLSWEGACLVTSGSSVGTTQYPMPPTGILVMGFGGALSLWHPSASAVGQDQVTGEPGVQELGEGTSSAGDDSA